MAAGDLALQLARGALGDQAAVVEYRDPVGELVGFLEVLGGEEHGDAAGHQAADDLPHGAAAARVKPGRRLVEEDDLRVADQRHRQVQLPAHAAGVGRHELARRFRQVEPLKQPAGDLLALAGAEVLEVRHQLQVFLPGQQLVHGGELPGDPDRRADRLSLGKRRRGRSDPRRPAVGLGQGGEDVDRGGFPGPVRAEQGEDRPLGDVEVDAVKYGLVPVGLAQPRGCDR